jgi:hypothetical protein
MQVICVWREMVGERGDSYGVCKPGFTDLGGYWWPPTYSNWLLLTIFSSTRSYVLLCNCGFYTFEGCLNPYTYSRWILVASHLIQLAYFGCFHVSTSFCTSGPFWGPKQCFLGYFHIKL